MHQLKEEGFQPTVIFTTAWEKYAIDAIRHAAFDYLLKPIDPSELGNAVHRLERNGKKDPVKQIESLLSWLGGLRRLQFHTRTGILFIDPADLFYCEANGNYTLLTLTAGRRELVTARWVVSWKCYLLKIF